MAVLSHTLACLLLGLLCGAGGQTQPPLKKPHQTILKESPNATDIPSTLDLLHSPNYRDHLKLISYNNDKNLRFINLMASQQQQAKPLPVIYTYFIPLDACDEICRKQNLMLLNLWQASWTENGWQPVILTEHDARKHPSFDDWVGKFAALPTQNDPQYELACYLRWVAMAAVGGGYMSDTDVINYKWDVKKDTDISKTPLPFTGKTDKMYAHMQNQLVSGTKQGYEELITRMTNYKPGDFEVGHPNFKGLDFKAHMSDMLIIMDLTYKRVVQKGEGLLWEVGTGTGWKKGRCVSPKELTPAEQGLADQSFKVAKEKMELQQQQENVMQLKMKVEAKEKEVTSRAKDLGMVIKNADSSLLPSLRLLHGADLGVELPSADSDPKACSPLSHYSTNGKGEVECTKLCKWRCIQLVRPISKKHIVDMETIENQLGGSSEGPATMEVEGGGDLQKHFANKTSTQQKDITTEVAVKEDSTRNTTNSKKLSTANPRNFMSWASKQQQLIGDTSPEHFLPTQ